MPKVPTWRIDKKQFIESCYKFKVFCDYDFYKQSINPMIVYTDNPVEEKVIKDIFARMQNDDEYVIIEYKGSNLLSKVETAIMGVDLNTC